MVLRLWRLLLPLPPPTLHLWCMDIGLTTGVSTPDALNATGYCLFAPTTAPTAGRKWTEVRTMPEFRRLTYKTPDGAWGIKGVSLLTCPARLYGAAAKLCDMESLCEDVSRAKDAELTLDALQELVDKGLGGRFIDLRKALKGVAL